VNASVTELDTGAGSAQPARSAGAGVSAAAREAGRVNPDKHAVLVTGGSGFLGGSLVRRLLADRVPTRVLVRSPAKAEQLVEEGAETVVGDITDERALDAALDGVTTVYHLAGRLLVPGVHAHEYHRTHVVGTQQILARCHERSSLARFVHCSTTGVLGVTGDQPVDEDAPTNPTNVYEATKAEAELAVREAMHDGLPAVIARPGLVYGPGDLHLLGFFRAVLRGRFRPVGRRPVLFHPIYIDDLVEALVRCGRWPLAVGECFHLAGQEPVSLAELAESIARAGGTRLPTGIIPLPFAHAAAAAGDLLPGRLRRSAPLTRSRLAFLTNSRVYDVTKARLLLDFSAPTDLETGVELTLDWYREHGHLPPARRVAESTQQGVRCESETT
jgi:nucleoside-diphosphate-sugar epimerase